jgi:GxxExxY protein
LLAAAVEVHRVLGPGFLESVYERALCVELGLRNLPYRRQIPILVDYKGHWVGESCLDLLIAERIVVELKAVETLCRFTACKSAHISRQPDVASAS